MSKQYKFKFTGDAIECFIAPLDREKAEVWLARGGEALLSHAFGLDDDELDESDPANFGRAADLAGAEQSHLPVLRGQASR